MTTVNNPSFDFMQKFSDVSEYNALTTYDFRGQSYLSLLPVYRNKFYTYHGSLTTPPYFESVTWIVYADHVPISSSQVRLE